MNQVRAGAATDVGCHRVLNEDAFLAGRRLFVVADGMGGHAAGDVASRLTIEVLKRADSSDLNLEMLRQSVSEANTIVLDYARANPESQGMGCTVAGVCLVESAGRPHWAVFNLGDSRVYAWDDHRLTQVTTDHSEVQELVDAGKLTSEEARVHPERNVVTRAIGEMPPAVLDLVLVPVIAGQRLLVTTDGLTSEVVDAEIAAILRDARDPQLAAERLIARAIEAGGHDNITVVVVDVSDTERPVGVGASTTVPRGLIARETVS